MSAERPGFRPMLPLRANELPQNLNLWSCEPKWEGRRAFLIVDKDGFKLIMDTGTDVSGKFPEFENTFRRIGKRRDLTIVDGLITTGPGVSEKDRQGVNERIRLSAPKSIAGDSIDRRASFIAIDLIKLNGKDATHLTYSRRKYLLGRIIPKEDSDVLKNLNIDASSPNMMVFAHNVRRLGLQGVVLKKNSSRYQQGRKSRQWLAMGFHSWGELDVELTEEESTEELDLQSDEV